MWAQWRPKLSASRLFTQPFFSGADQRKCDSSASLAFVRGIHRWPVNSQHKGPVTRKMFPFDDVILYNACDHLSMLVKGATGACETHTGRIKSTNGAHFTNNLWARNLNLGDKHWVSWKWSLRYVNIRIRTHPWSHWLMIFSLTYNFLFQFDRVCDNHYNDVIITTMASQITSLTIIYSNVYSDADQRKHQSSASLAFVWGIHRWPVNSPHKGPVTWKNFPFDDVIMSTHLKTEQ